MKRKKRTQGGPGAPRGAPARIYLCACLSGIGAIHARTIRSRRTSGSPASRSKLCSKSSARVLLAQCHLWDCACALPVPRCVLSHVRVDRIARSKARGRSKGAFGRPYPLAHNNGQRVWTTSSSSSAHPCIDPTLLNPRNPTQSTNHKCRQPWRRQRAGSAGCGGPRAARGRRACWGAWRRRGR